MTLRHPVLIRVGHDTCDLNGYFYTSDGTRYLICACDREGVSLFNADRDTEEIEVAWEKFENDFSHVHPED